MSYYIRRVGKVTFKRTTRAGEPARVTIHVDAGDIIPGCTEGEVTVRILEDKRIFDASTFAAFCNEENAKKMVDSYVRPLLGWLGA